MDKKEHLKKAMESCVVINYPTSCPHCTSTAFHPITVVGETHNTDPSVSWFQCEDQVCRKVFGVRLNKTSADKHLVLLFAPDMPLAMLMIEGAQPEAVKADLVYRIRKKFGNDAMMLIGTTHDLFNAEAVTPWLELLEETNKFVEAPTGGFTEETPENKVELRKIVDPDKLVDIDITPIKLKGKKSGKKK